MADKIVAKRSTEIRAITQVGMYDPVSPELFDSVAASNVWENRIVLGVG
jgi:hypothetical protein